ncbi:hypothetical protein KJ807_05665 [Patescibacteria group bacterium]|nr:hypothetical protein [Patescibacteria group bacterium]
MIAKAREKGKEPMQESEEDCGNATCSNCKIQSSEFECDPAYGYPTMIEELDRMDIPHNFFAIMVGRRRSGKTFFARWFLEPHKDTYDKVIVVTKTKMNAFWAKIVGSDFVHEGWAKGRIVVKKLMEHQKKQIQKRGGPDNMPDDDDHSYDPDNVLLIIDDIISDKIHDDPVINELPVAGRHYNIAVMVMTQAPKAIGTHMRDNADLAVVFQQINARNRESVQEDYIATIDKHAALSMLDAYTGDYNFLATRMFKQSNEATERFRRGKAEEVENFAMGGPEQRRIIEKERARNEAKQSFSERVNKQPQNGHGSARTSSQRGVGTNARKHSGVDSGSGLAVFRDSTGKTRVASEAYSRLLGH